MIFRTLAIPVLYLLVGLGSTFLLSCQKQPDPSTTNNYSAEVKILVFSKTEGYRHASIPAGVAALKKIGLESNWFIKHTEDAAIFTPDSLDKYRLIIFLNTTGDILSDQQQTAFEQFFAGGGGFVGIHSASDTEYDWPWYGRLVGAYFESHPQIQEARIEVTDRNHPSTQMLPAEWIRTDEWYNFRDISPDINVLMRLDESSYEGGKNGDYHPIAWYQEYAGGRMFYTAGGHTSESYAEELFIQHLQGGITFVIGDS